MALNPRYAIDRKQITFAINLMRLSVRLIFARTNSCELGKLVIPGTLYLFLLCNTNHFVSSYIKHSVYLFIFCNTKQFVSSCILYYSALCI